MKIERLDFEHIGPAAQVIGLHRQNLGLPASFPELEDYLFVQLSREDAFCFLVWDESSPHQFHPIAFLQVIPTMQALHAKSFLLATDLLCLPHPQQPMIFRLMLDAAYELVQFRGDHGLIVETGTNQSPLHALCQERHWQPLHDSTRFLAENALPVPTP